MTLGEPPVMTEMNVDWKILLPSAQNGETVNQVVIVAAVQARTIPLLERS